MANGQLKRILRRRPQIDEAEFELLQSRVLARLQGTAVEEAPAAADALDDVASDGSALDPVGIMAAPGSDVWLDPVPVMADPVADPTYAEPAYAEIAVAEPALAEPAYAEPAYAEPAYAEIAVAEPAFAEPDFAEVAVGEPAVAEPDEIDADLSRADSAEDLFAETEIVDENAPIAWLVADPVDALLDVEPMPDTESAAGAVEAIDLDVVAEVIPQPGIIDEPEIVPELHGEEPVAIAAPQEIETAPEIVAVTKAPPKRRARPARPRPTPVKPAASPRQIQAKPAASPHQNLPPRHPAAVAGPAPYCPYCALLLEPPPESSRRCPRCRERIVVKRVDGRPVYLTEASLAIFETERRRVANKGRWTKERGRWLKAAASVEAPPEKIARLERAPLSDEVVASARSLYFTTVDRSFRAAKRDRRWEDASRVMREHAMVLFKLAGSPIPPPEESLDAHRLGAAAALRGIGEMSRVAELVSGKCCDTCRADDGSVFKIAVELRQLRLPHASCPKGLCRCDWFLAVRDQSLVRRQLRRRARTESAVRSST